jgi:hypothetical protein
LPTTSASVRTIFPAIEANSRRAGPKLQQLFKYLGCAFDELFETILVNPETGEEWRLVAKT